MRTACRKIVRGDPEKLLEQVGPGLVFSVEGVVFAHGLTLKDAGRDKKAVGVISRDEYKRGVVGVGPPGFFVFVSVSSLSYFI